MKNAFGPLFRRFVVVSIGAAAIFGVAGGLDLAPGTPVLWWAARALGLVAYFALWLSMLFGVFVGSRGAGGLLDRATIIQLHNRWAVAGLVATILHVVVIVADANAGIGLWGALVPLASPTLTAAVALGTFALWGLVAIGLSTHLLDRMPSWVWRAVHASAFGVFLLALVHGISAGTETSAFAARAVYATTTAALVAAIIQRVLLHTRRRPQGDAP